MAFVWAALIGGCTCAAAQILVECKIPFPFIAILFTSLGGILTGIGPVSLLQSLGAAGISVTAMGCGNGAYSAGVELASGNIAPLIPVFGLNVLLVAMGALCGCVIAKK
ncbi:MAG: hypothetical protein LIO92_11625 [Clostridiales bacterium]|nr:hypothetical protein [Clostridiales bacterium]